MKRYDVAELIAETPKVHGVFEPPIESTREVFCEVRSVSRSEVYQGMAVGVTPTVIFVLSIDEDYQNEKELIYHGERYRVIRTYIADDGIELTCEVTHGENQSGS